MAWAAIEPSDSPSLAIGCSKAEQPLCLQIPGCTYSKKDGIWRAPLSWATYVAFKTVWASQPIVETAQLIDWAASRWADVQIAYGLRSQLDTGDAELGTLLDDLDTASPGKALFTYQRGAVSWLVRMRRAILADPRGNGKSPPLIRALQVLNRRGQGCPALIIAPGSAVLAWRDKLNDWAPELSVRVVAGSALRRRQALDGEQADVYVMAWPNVRMHTRLAAYPSQAFVRCDEHGGVDGKSAAYCEVHEKELNAIPFQTVIPDECHRMKDARSKQTRAVWWLAHNCQNFWPATGTPVTDTIADIWPVLHAIDPREAPVRGRYLDLFAVKNLAWHGGTEILGIKPETEHSYQAIVQPLARRIPREVARPYQPPLLEPEFRYPEMSPAQARIYRQLRKELLADLEGTGTVVPANGMVRFGRMCQVASATIECEDGEDPDGFTSQHVRLALPSSKADDLLEFLEDNPGQLVVAANSPQLVKLCERKLGVAKITSTKIVGGMGYEQQYQAANLFQDGQVRVIFITAAGAEAIDLFAASTVYFIQPDPVFVSREQKIGRVDRIGQRFAVRQVYAITPGTVEQHLYDLGNQKESRAAQVTRDADLMRWLAKGDDNERAAAVGTAAEIPTSL